MRNRLFFLVSAMRKLKRLLFDPFQFLPVPDFNNQYDETML
jgi:hypothetical protein